MAYIISVNATILTESGGTCDCTGGPSVCLADPVYQECLSELKKDFITATSAISLIGCIAMGLVADLPIAIAPSLGLNAYFVYHVVGFHGTGKVRFETALAAVFLEGIIFLLLSALGLRQILTKAIPMSIKVATSAGIGLFLTFIGLQNSAGIGLVSGNAATLVGLGGCPPWAKNSDTNHCEGHTMEGPTTWLGILGFLIIAVLMSFRVKGAILLSILFISIISWFRGTNVTYFPYSDAGDAAFTYFKGVVALPKIRTIAGSLDFDLGNTDVWIALITFLYVDILDATGTMFSMAKYAGVMDEDGDFEGSYAAFLVDAFTVTLSGPLGSSPATAYIESGAGIAEGGRTGLTAITTGFFFILSLFFAPIFASFPPWATGPALIMVGVLMAQTAFATVNWNYLPDAIPAFLTIALMPLTYSIAYGLIAGIGSYLIINTVILVLRKASKDKLRPADFEEKEVWGPKRKEDLYPLWVKHLLANKAKKPDNAIRSVDTHDDQPVEEIKIDVERGEKSK
ncbi:hypothetical protein HDU85_004423 [Gaertneriomyces sp. JEL0708]|nr:hypothetical protein HDU85_004423 [Gaertneriomyces sp. JEL0708]